MYFTARTTWFSTCLKVPYCTTVAPTHGEFQSTSLLLLKAPALISVYTERVFEICGGANISHMYLMVCYGVLMTVVASIRSNNGGDENGLLYDEDNFAENFCSAFNSNELETRYPNLTLDVEMIQFHDK